MRLSLIIPCYNEEGNVEKFFSEVKRVFDGKVEDCEFVFVNGASDFRLMKRTMVDAVLQMTEFHRFSKGIFSYVGFNTKYIPYTVAERESGESKWSVKKLTKYAFEGIFAFSTTPLKISTFVGLLSALGSLVYLIVILVMKYGSNAAIPSYSAVIVLLLLVGGLILFCLGIVGEYLSKMYVQVKNRPVYIVKEHLNSSKK